MLLLAGVTVVTFARPCTACQCGVPPDDIAFKQAHVVFTGTVIETANKQYVTEAGAFPTFILEVHSVEKGGTLKYQPVATAGPIGCGYDFQVGSRYQVFGRRIPGGFFAGSCSGTRELNAYTAWRGPGSRQGLNPYVRGPEVEGLDVSATAIGTVAVLGLALAVTLKHRSGDT